MKTMAEASISPSEISYNSCINACGSSPQWLVALQVLGDITHTSLPASTIVYNSCISACDKGAQWQLALALLKEMTDMKLEREAIVHSAGFGKRGYDSWNAKRPKNNVCIMCPENIDQLQLHIQILIADVAAREREEQARKSLRFKHTLDQDFSKGGRIAYAMIKNPPKPEINAICYKVTQNPVRRVIKGKKKDRQYICIHYIQTR
jgi:hypothetical protein